MKYFILLSFLAFQSFTIEKKTICDYSIIPRTYDCDSINNIWKSSFDLGIRRMNLANINIDQKYDSLYIIAQVIDKNSEEALPYSSVYSLDGDESTCAITRLPFQADENGYFRIVLKANKQTRLLFSFLAMENIELKIHNCH